MSSPAPVSGLESAVAEWFVERPIVGERLPAALLSRDQKARELQRVQAAKAMLAAHEADLVNGLADDTPDDVDPPADHPGARKASWAPDPELPGVSEFFVPELAMVLNSSRGAAARLARRSRILREKLPATNAALAAGELDDRRAGVFIEVLEQAAPAVARSVEAEVLPHAVGLALPRLRRRLEKALLVRDQAASEQRREHAERDADVRSYPKPDGMAVLAADLTAPVSAACIDRIDRLASMLKADGDERPIGQLRAGVLADLILRPWETSGAPVTGHVTVTAPLPTLNGASAEPGDVDGRVITAGHVRELVGQLGAVGPGGLQCPPGGSLTVAVTDADGTLLATATRPELERIARRGCPEHPASDCGCAVLGWPPEVDRYEPTPAQRVWVKTRDRTCRFPNCGQPVGWADLDHVVSHACGGETACSNLCCLCRSHHRLKTFARGWTFTMSDDGVLSVTTPSGITRVTRPPGQRPRGQPPPSSMAETPGPSPDPDPAEHLAPAEDEPPF
jgi:hypothetical protein